MRHRIAGAAFAAAAALLCAQPAAADNYVVKDGQGALQNFASKLVGGIQYPFQILAGMFGGAPVPISTDASGNINTNVISLPATSVVIGKVGIDQTTPGTTNGVQLVQPLPAGTNNVGTFGVLQGATSSGLYGPLIQGAVSSSSPSWTSGQVEPLSLDAAGNLRVNIVAGAAAGGTSSAFSSAFPVNGTAIGAKNGSNMVSLAADSASNLETSLCGAGGSTCAGILSGAATSSLSNSQNALPTVDFMRAFNGSTWDAAASVQGATGGAGQGVLATHLTPNSSANVAITPVVSSTLESSHVLKSSAGNLYRIRITTTSAGYLMLFNATSAPADGAVTPQSCTQVGSGSNELDHANAPDRFSTGIVAVFSTTGCFTKTASASAMFEGSVE